MAMAFRIGVHALDIAWPAPFTIGESGHDNHHEPPRSARRGRGARLDTSAVVIRMFERFGWVTGVHRPRPPAVSTTVTPKRRAAECPLGRARCELHLVAGHTASPATVAAYALRPSRNGA